MNKEKVMFWLKICGKEDDCSAICPYRLGRPTCMRKLMADAYECMKEQEAKSTLTAGTNKIPLKW